VQAQAGGQLVNDLIGRILDVQPERLACLDELRYQRRGGFPGHLAAVINPAPHGSRLRDSIGVQRLASAAAKSLGTQPPGKASAYRSRPTLTSGTKTLTCGFGCALGGTRAPASQIRRPCPAC